ncbi:MAG TPA: acyclic terpene utilization AtuA family protein, partial [Rhizomicrobium sp.]|nr:acyclic terpene utilization AtuA family protein [Rhizomicrobium sp.]
MTGASASGRAAQSPGRGSGRKVRIGCGAGFSGDRIEPAVILAENGKLDYLVFECLAERTIAMAVRDRLKQEDAAYDPLLGERLGAVLPAAVRNKVRIISNMGAANPVAAGRHAAQLGRTLGLGPLKIAAITGDDVLSQLRASDRPLMDSPGTVWQWTGDLISANAYLGAEPIVSALQQGADIVITGRAADPSLFLAPLVHEFDWRWDDWERLGRGTIIGHLLECAGQITGGYFADPGVKDVEGLANLGFPLAEVAPDGQAVLTKVPGTGGEITLATCKEQLLYELHDPTRYLTPDVVADFSTVRFDSDGKDRIAVSGGGGNPRPEKLKVSVGYREGFAGEGQISYAGPGAVERGRLALAIIEERLRRHGKEILDLRLELIGLDSVDGKGKGAPREVRVRAAARMRTYEGAALVGREVEALYTNGPAAGGGATRCT